MRTLKWRNIILFGSVLTIGIMILCKIIGNYKERRQTRISGIMCLGSMHAESPDKPPGIGIPNFYLLSGAVRLGAVSLFLYISFSRIRLECGRPPAVKCLGLRRAGAARRGGASGGAAWAPWPLLMLSLSAPAPLTPNNGGGRPASPAVLRRPARVNHALTEVGRSSRHRPSCGIDRPGSAAGRELLPLPPLCPAGVNCVSADLSFRWWPTRLCWLRLAR